MAFEKKFILAAENLLENIKTVYFTVYINIKNIYKLAHLICIAENSYVAIT